MTPAIRAAIREIDPNQPLYDVFPMTDFIARTLLAQRLNLVLVGSFAVLALVAGEHLSYTASSRIMTARRLPRVWRPASSWQAPRQGAYVATVLRESLARASVGLAAGLLLRWRYYAPALEHDSWRHSA